MGELLRIGGLGGLIGLDGTSVGQFMVSRPLVAGLLAGLLVGDPALGGSIGVILEFYLLVSFPIGGARFPEGSTATVVSVAVAVPFSGPGALPLAVAFGLVWGQLGGASVTALRHLNARLVPEAGAGRDGAARVALYHPLAICLDWVRGSAITLTGVVVGRAVLTRVVDGWPLDEVPSLSLLLVGGAVSAGILLRDLGGFRRRRVWLVAGLALGIVGARFL